MGWLCRCGNNVGQVVQQFNHHQVTGALAGFRARLNGGQNPIIRLWIEDAPNLGNQSSSVNLIYRFALPYHAQNSPLNFGYNGTIEVYYQPANNTLDKIRQLMPELAGGNQAQIGAATVNLIAYQNAPGQQVDFGFTGAADNPPPGGFLNDLNVQYFLRLQPYAWPHAEEFITAQATTDLNAQPELGGAAFNRRLYHIAPNQYQFVIPPQNPTAHEQIINQITTDNFLQNHELQAIYSFKEPLVYFAGNPVFAVAVACGAALRWQRNGNNPYQHAKPVVIINFDRFGDPNNPNDTTSLDAVRDYLEGRTPQTAQPAIGPQQQRDTQRREQYFAQMRVQQDNRFHFVNYPQSLQDVTQALQNVTGHNDRILWIQLGYSTPLLYSWTMFRSSLPPVFEGQNTTNAIINMGRPYMQLPKAMASAEEAGTIYPSVRTATYNAGRVPRDLIAAALEFRAQSVVWPRREQNAAPTKLALYYRRYSDNPNQNNPIRRYFTELRDVYTAPERDKLASAIAFVEELIEDDQQFLAQAPGNDALNELYTKLEGAVSVGKPLDLIPGVLTKGAISDFVLTLLEQFSASGLSLTVEKFEHKGDPGSITEITLAGPSPALKAVGVTVQANVVFTLVNRALTAQIKLTTQGSFSAPSAPWIALEDPYMELRVSEGKFPASAYFGGTYPAMASSNPAIQANFRIPIFDTSSVWSASLEFEQTFPSIATAFQLATSINLVALMPPPLATLTDLGVQRVESSYDFQKGSVESILIAARSNTKGVPLVGKLKLENVQLLAVIVDPAGDRSLSATASAEFAIGAGEEAGIITLAVEYPSWTFSGALSSGVIKIADVIDLFVPGVELSLPQLPNITDFSFTYDKATDAMAVSMQLNIHWGFGFPDKPDLITVNQLGFVVSRSAGANTGALNGSVTLFPGTQDPPTLGMVAGYNGKGKGWTFRLQQSSGVFSVADVIHAYLSEAIDVPEIFPEIKDLSLVIDTGAGSYEFSAATAKPWQPISVVPVSATRVKLKVGYTGKNQVTLRSGSVLTNGKGAYYGELGGEFRLWSIDLQVLASFKQGEAVKVCVVWVPMGLQACVEKDSKTGDTVAIFSVPKKSIGEMVEEFVSWVTGSRFALAAPFDVLNQITLTDFAVVYNFNERTVKLKVNLGPIDLGLFTLQAIGLDYYPKAAGTKEDPKTRITVDAKFVWAQDTESMTWDPSRPDSTPPAPGAGSKYLDLRLLALGQHVTVAGLTQQKRVQDVIKLLRNLKEPEPPEIPIGGLGQPVFAPESSWFVAMDFGVLRADTPSGGGGKALAQVPQHDGTLAELLRVDALAAAPPVKKSVYFIQLSIVFNDPYLYALRIALDGPMAKVLAGLDFQIMYRQVSDSVGVYSAEVALPEIMRRLQVGVATITLPTFGIDLYTNGDFQVDIGFPWNQDFSRSFTIEAVVAPGIPLLGSAGFYFGKLSSATTDKVPAASNGWFNPVLVFGFGAQFGLGKSIEAGILRAGLSLTIFGIIEGVLARWLPYDGSNPNSRKSDLQDGYYFALTGAVGVLGKLYGSVDFAVVKADVNVEIKLMITLRLAAYEDIPISASASVRVTASIKIDLGLFSIRLSFSFSATVSATFVIQNPWGDPPWIVASNPARALTTRGLRMLSVREKTAAGYEPVWTNLEKGAPLNLEGYVAPSLTVAGDRATAAADQLICFGITFLLDTPAPIERSSTGGGASLAESDAARAGAEHHELAHRALDRARRRDLGARGTKPTAGVAQDAAPDSFEDFVVRVLQWLIAAGQSKPLSIEEVNALILQRDELEKMLDYFSDPDRETKVPVDAAEGFLGDQVQVTFRMPKEAGEAHGVFFPAPPATRLKVADYGEWKGFDYTFGGYTTTSDRFRSDLRKYFDALRVQVQPPSVDDPSASAVKLPATAMDVGRSVGSYVFSDYFAAIARQGVGALLAGLRNFQYVISDAPGATVADIVRWVNERSGVDDPGAGASEVEPFTATDLFVANQDHSFTTGKTLTIRAMTATIPGGSSFAQIAASPVYNGGFDGKVLARANASDTRVLMAGVEIDYDGGAQKHTVQSGDSIESIASLFKISVDDLLDKSNVVTEPKLPAPLTILTFPDFPYETKQGDTPRSVSAAFGIGQERLASVNTGVAELFSVAPDPNLNIPHLAQFRVGELFDEARRTLSLQNLGASLSRFYLHGLRIPTDGVSPQARGLFVEEKDGGFVFEEAELGLFAVTGQVFPLPDLQHEQAGPGDPSFQFVLTRGDGEQWLGFGDDHDASITYALTDESDRSRYEAVRSVARQGPLSTKMQELGALGAAQIAPSRFPLSNEASWQPAIPVELPHRTLTPTVPRPRIWPLSPSLINLPNEAGPLPVLAPKLVRHDPASGDSQSETLANWGFGTLISFKVKRVQGIASSPTTQATYELLGAGMQDIVLLERLLNQLRGDETSFQQMLLLYPESAAGSGSKGWVSADPSRTTVGITQVNLSTETRPPALARPFGADDATPLGNVINRPTEFLRLLWEGSITRQGGFYLTYYDATAEAGLPDEVFNDNGEAEVAMLALFKATGDDGQALTNFVNVLVTDEGFDLESVAIVAESVRKLVTTRETRATDTLRSFAAAHYLDAVSFFEQTPEATLRAGAALHVTDGLYQVPPLSGSPTLENPGGDLKLIAQHFGTTVDDLQKANPHRASWPDPLPVLDAVALPALSVVVGSGPGGSTLAAMAAYYGTTVAAVSTADGNLDQEGLLADDQTFSIKTGPVERSATLPAGVAGFRLVREGPANPGGGTPTEFDGEAYLQAVFSLLGFRVERNADFKQSNSGLPAGPVDPESDSTPGKVRAPRAEGANDSWVYEQAIPYPSFWAPQLSHGSGGAGAPSPYTGVGGLLQLKLDWRDVFGNRIVSDLTSPTSGGSTPLNDPPQRLGYVDELLGLGQWPSVSAAYRVFPSSDNQAMLEIVLDFDTGPFAPPANTNGADDEQRRRQRIRQAQQILKRLLQQLNDPAGVGIEVTTTLLPKAGSILSADDQRSVSSWVESLSAWLNSLLPESGVTTPEDVEPIKTLTLPLNVDWSGQSERALNDDEIFIVETTFSLVRKDAHVTGALRASGIARADTKLAPYTGALSKVEGATAQARRFRQIAGVAEDATLRDLAPFAAAFTAAFSKLAGRRLEIAIGTDRERFQAGGRTTLWAVELGLAKGQPISYEVMDAGAKMYAPRPISNHLESRSNIPIYPYETGKGIDFDDPNPARHSFDGIDMDRWMSQALTWIDDLLTPEYVTPALLLREKKGVDYLEPLLAAKRSLAAALKLAMIPIYADESASDDELKSIRSSFEQQMLVLLGAFYTTKAGLQFRAKVHAAIAQGPKAIEPPRIQGDIHVGTPSASGACTATTATPLHKNFSLTSPKLELAFASTDPNERCLDTLLATTTVLAKELTLDLTYQGSFIEHEIGRLEGIDGYEPSSWLTFVRQSETKTASWPLTRALGEQKVPLAVREFPATPTLVKQEMVSHGPGAAELAATEPGNCNPLMAVTRWTYGFTYARDFSRQQDRVYGKIVFNESVGAFDAEALPERTLFGDLAQMLQVYPAVLEDLNSKLSTLEFSSPADDPGVEDAVVALESATALVKRLAETAKNLTVRSRKALATAVPPLEFHVDEGQVEKTDPDGKQVQALLVTLTVSSGAFWTQPEGAPYVDLQPELYERVAQGGERALLADAFTAESSEWKQSWVYRSKLDGKFLTAEQAVSISDRLFRQPYLDVLRQQDAQTTIYLTRNEVLVDGKRSADPFIYTTPDVTFPNALLPTITWDDPINIATVFADDCEKPVSRSLQAHLEALYQALFAHPSVDDNTLQLVVYYDYSINAKLDPIELATYMMPPTSTAVASGGAGRPLADVIADQVKGVEAWFNAHEPSQTRGILRLCLTIMSNLTVRPMPVLRLTGLYLPVEYIVPRL